MNTKKLLTVVIGAMVMWTSALSACNKENGGGTKLPTTPKIAVISDLHYFDLSLLESKGTAFEEYIAGDRKLIEESSAIARSVIGSLLAENPDIVFVCGDLTKDGEKKSHESVAALLGELRDAGIEVLVTPGNHDIDNPHSLVFNGAGTTPAPAVSQAEFKSIYNDFGFADAIATGPDLCYVSEPAKDLWIISIDACEYKDNAALGKPATQGNLSAEKLEWVIEKTEEGVAKGKRVMGIMHHGLLEHYAGQKTLFPEYVIADWENVSGRLANAGMKVVFTGHYHAQDVVKKNTESAFIFDIETGSTVTAPCPYRIVRLDGDRMTIASKIVQSIDFAGIPAGMTFPQYATKFLSDGMLVVSKYMLMAPPYNVPQAQAEQVSPLFAETFVAHYAGDEAGHPSAQTQPILDMLLAAPEYAMIGQAVMSVWNDPAPADNDLTIDLATGAAN